MYKFVCFLDGNATEKVSRADYIWELNQGRRGRKGESHLRVSAIISALLQVVWLTKRTLTIVELSWYERFGKREKRLTSFSTSSHVVRTIAHRSFHVVNLACAAEKDTYNEKSTCKACKIIVFHWPCLY